MKGLLIEDDQIKASEIINFLTKNSPNLGKNLIHRKSYQSGIKEIFESTFDFILLDMSIPTYDQDQGNFSGKPRNYGGRDILKEMKRYKKVSSVLVITQYNEFDGGSMSIKDLDKELRIKYNNLYNGYVYYKTGQTEWEINLLRFIDTI
jgi:CheY-like chemotaxis protein